MEKNNNNNKNTNNIKVGFVGDMGVGKTMLFMRVNNILNNKEDYKSQNDFISQKENLINNTTKNGCLTYEKELTIDDEGKNKYILELWDLSNTFNTFRFNRFPITRKFYFVQDAQIIILCCEPRMLNTFETMKILFDISKTRADPKAIYVLCVTKCDLNYSEDELKDIKKYAKDNNMELIYTSSFKDNFGLEDIVLKKLIARYNENNSK